MTYPQPRPQRRSLCYSSKHQQPPNPTEPQSSSMTETCLREPLRQIAGAPSGPEKCANRQQRAVRPFSELHDTLRRSDYADGQAEISMRGRGRRLQRKAAAMPAQAGYVIAEKKELDRLHDKIARLVSRTEPISNSGPRKCMRLRLCGKTSMFGRGLSRYVAAVQVGHCQPAPC